MTDRIAGAAHSHPTDANIPGLQERRPRFFAAGFARPFPDSALGGAIIASVSAAPAAAG